MNQQEIKTMSKARQIFRRRKMKYISSVTPKGNSSFSYESQEQAERNAIALDEAGCTNCRDCLNCLNCHDCEDCTGCKGSRSCVACHDCEACVACLKCRACIGCEGCTNCTNCDFADCRVYVRCTDNN